MSTWILLNQENWATAKKTKTGLTCPSLKIKAASAWYKFVAKQVKKTQIVAREVRNLKKQNCYLLSLSREGTTSITRTVHFTFSSSDESSWIPFAELGGKTKCQMQR